MTLQQGITKVGRNYWILSLKYIETEDKYGEKCYLKPLFEFQALVNFPQYKRPHFWG